MTRVLVTGAAGFIGQHLVRSLSREGYAVRAAVHHREASVVFPSEVEEVEGDVRDSTAMKTAAAGCELIFHLAGKAHAVQERRSDEGDYQTVNVEGTRNVLEGGLAGGARRILLWSSVKVFGESTSECLDESATPRPATPYGRSKLAAERLLEEYGTRAGLSVASLRLPLVYGPSHKGNLSRMIAAIDRGRFPPLPHIETVRSMLHVENLTQAALLVARSQTPLRPSYIVTDARPYSITEIYESLCRGLGRAAPRWRVPRPVLQAAAWCGDVWETATQRPAVFSTVTWGKLASQAWYTPAAITRELGYCPSLSFSDAVPQMVASYRRGGR